MLDRLALAVLRLGMHTISPSDRFAVGSSVVFRELSGETVLLNLESGVYFGLDPVGTRIWSLLAQNHPLATVCSIMLGEFEVEAGVLERDVLRLVSELCEKGLVTPGSAESPAPGDR